MAKSVAKNLQSVTLFDGWKESAFWKPGPDLDKEIQNLVTDHEGAFSVVIVNAQCLNLACEGYTKSAQVKTNATD